MKSSLSRYGQCARKMSRLRAVTMGLQQLSHTCHRSHQTVVEWHLSCKTIQCCNKLYHSIERCRLWGPCTCRTFAFVGGSSSVLSLGEIHSISTWFSSIMVFFPVTVFPLCVIEWNDNQWKSMHQRTKCKLTISLADQNCIRYFSTVVLYYCRRNSAEDGDFMLCSTAFHQRTIPVPYSYIIVLNVERMGLYYFCSPILDKNPLLNHLLHVNIKNTMSSLGEIRTGVPQESVLGTSLFILDTILFSTVIFNSSVNHQLSADYTKLFLLFPASEFAHNIIWTYYILYLALDVF
jgi:hypothetical protein